VPNDSENPYDAHIVFEVLGWFYQSTHGFPSGPVRFNAIERMCAEPLLSTRGGGDAASTGIFLGARGPGYLLQ
jgi:hypothetical protein